MSTPHHSYRSWQDNPYLLAERRIKRLQPWEHTYLEHFRTIVYREGGYGYQYRVMKSNGIELQRFSVTNEEELKAVIELASTCQYGCPSKMDWTPPLKVASIDHHANDGVTDKIIELYQQGWYNEDIARELKTTTRQVSYRLTMYLKRMGML